MRGLSLAALAAVLAAWPGGPAAAQTFHYKSISISAYPRPNQSDEPSHGYVEHRFEITNHSATAHTVEIRLPDPLMYGSQARANVIVAGGAASELLVYQPATHTYGSGASVYVDGQAQQDPMSIRCDRSGDGRLAALCTRNVPEDLRRKIEDPHPISTAIGSAVVRHAFPGTTSLSPQLVCVSELPVQRWSPNWLGYGEYDFVVLTRADLDAMPPAVWGAIREWTQAGGRLIVVDDPKAAQPWAPPPEWTGSKDTYNAGLGRCARCAPGTFDWGAYSRRLESAGLWNIAGADDLNRHFRLTEVNTNSAKIMLALLLPVAVVIGPVNLYLLARRNKRIWMVLTVPVLSLAACGALLGYSLLSEGTRAWAKTVELTVLDERTHTASSIGYLALYSPLTQGGGLTFERCTEVTLQGTADVYGRVDRKGGVVDWSNRQHLASGWVQARVPAFFQLRKSQTRRERLSVSRQADGSLGVVNGLGVGIKQLWLCGDDGTVYTCSAIPAGQAAKLTAQAHPASEPGEEAPARPAPLEASSLYVEDWKTVASSARSGAARLMAPMRYVAVLEAPAFLEMPLEKVQLRDSQSVVIGTLAEWPEATAAEVAP